MAYSAAAEGSEKALGMGAKFTGDGDESGARTGESEVARQDAGGAGIEHDLDVIEVVGAIKWFDVAKGFGFIVPDDGSKDAFVHISALERAGISDLAEGQKVSYDLENGRDGRASAINVKLAD